MNKEQLSLFEDGRQNKVEGNTTDSESAEMANKGELHVHLNGAVPASTVLEILTQEGGELPHGFSPERDLVRRIACRSLREYLVPWQVLRLIPRRRENLQPLVDAAVKELSLNGIRFIELRSSVFYLATLQQCSVPEALDRLLSCTDQAAKNHGMQRGLVLTVSRGDYSAVHLAGLLSAYEALGRPADVVGIDLAGDEDIPYPEELPDLFRQAKDKYGLGVTIHAGETGRSESVRSAVELFDADRIGHGTAAGADPSLMELLAKRDVCVEVCPISNRLTGAVSPAQAHPLREFQEHGVPFVICSDNPAIHERGLAEDYAVALSEGIYNKFINNQYELAKRYSFIRGLI